MRDVDSDALRVVEQTLGIGRPASATRPVELDNDVLQMVWDVGGQIRRGVAPPSSEGIFTLAMKHDHPTSDGVIESSIDPYDGDGVCEDVAGDWDIGGLWPLVQNDRVRQGIDVWLLYSAAVIVAGPTNFDSAVLELRFGASQNALHCNQDLGTRRALPIALYDADSVKTLTAMGNNLSNLVGVGAGPYHRWAIRIPRGCSIRWRSANKNNGAMQNQLTAILGYMGAAQGQDGAL